MQYTFTKVFDCKFLWDFGGGNGFDPSLDAEIRINKSLNNQYDDFGMKVGQGISPLLILALHKIQKNQYIQDGSNFIFSILDQTSTYSQVIVLQKLNKNTKNFDHKIFVLIDDKIENVTLLWRQIITKAHGYQFIYFFIFLNLSLRLSYFNRKRICGGVKMSNGLPQFTQIINFHMGRFDRIEQIGQDYKQFTRFKCQVSYPFITNGNIKENFEQCFDYFFQQNSCLQSLVEKATYFEINKYLQTKQVSVSNFYRVDLLKFSGWIKLDSINIDKETLIIRITTNNYYSNDSFISDKFFYLVYIQNNISEFNGCKLTTTNAISDFDKKYQEYFIQWHFFQFESGPLYNNGQPLFRIYIPNQETLSFTQSKKINYFSLQALYFSIGGDKFSTSFLKGYLSYFTASSNCDHIAYEEIVHKCHFTCQTSDGLTKFSCLSCSVENFRQFKEQDKSCNCQEGYYEGIDKICCVFQLSKKFQMISLKNKIRPLILLNVYMDAFLCDKAVLNSLFQSSWQKNRDFMC